MHENQTLAEVWSNVKEPPPSKSVEASKITIDGVCISVEIGQQSWWARASRNILISFSLEEANSKVDECSNSKDNAQDLPAVVIISNTSVGKSSLIEEVVGYNRCLLRSGGSRLRQGLE
jgi:predicted GTPase